MATYKGRTRRVEHRRRNTSRETGKNSKFLVKLGHQFVGAAVLLAAIYFISGIQTPNMQSLRTNIKQVLSYNMDFEWLSDSISNIFDYNKSEDNGDQTSPSEDQAEPAPTNTQDQTGDHNEYDSVPAGMEESTEDVFR